MNSEIDTTFLLLLYQNLLTCTLYLKRNCLYICSVYKIIEKKKKRVELLELLCMNISLSLVLTLWGVVMQMQDKLVFLKYVIKFLRFYHTMSVSLIGILWLLVQHFDGWRWKCSKWYWIEQMDYPSSHTPWNAMVCKFY